MDLLSIDRVQGQINDELHISGIEESTSGAKGVSHGDGDGTHIAVGSSSGRSKGECLLWFPRHCTRQLLTLQHFYANHLVHISLGYHARQSIGDRGEPPCYSTGIPVADVFV